MYKQFNNVSMYHEGFSSVLMTSFQPKKIIKLIYSQQLCDHGKISP